MLEILFFVSVQILKKEKKRKKEKTHKTPYTLTGESFTHRNPTTNPETVHSHERLGRSACLFFIYLFTLMSLPKEESERGRGRRGKKKKEKEGEKKKKVRKVLKNPLMSDFIFI